MANYGWSHFLLPEDHKLRHQGYTDWWWHEGSASWSKAPPFFHVLQQIFAGDILAGGIVWRDNPRSRSEPRTPTTPATSTPCAHTRLNMKGGRWPQLRVQITKQNIIHDKKRLESVQTSMTSTLYSEDQTGWEEVQEHMREHFDEFTLAHQYTSGKYGGFQAVCKNCGAACTFDWSHWDTPERLALCRAELNTFFGYETRKEGQLPIQ